MPLLGCLTQCKSNWLNPTMLIKLYKFLSVLSAQRDILSSNKTNNQFKLLRLDLLACKILGVGTPFYIVKNTFGAGFISMNIFKRLQICEVFLALQIYSDKVPKSFL